MINLGDFAFYAIIGVLIGKIVGLIALWYTSRDKRSEIDRGNNFIFNSEGKIVKEKPKE